MTRAYGSPASRRSASWPTARARSGWFSTRSAWNAARATVRAGALASFARPAASSSTAVGEGGTWAQAQNARIRTRTRRRIRWLSERGAASARGHFFAWRVVGAWGRTGSGFLSLDVLRFVVPLATDFDFEVVEGSVSTIGSGRSGGSRPIS